MKDTSRKCTKLLKKRIFLEFWKLNFHGTQPDYQSAWCCCPKLRGALQRTVKKMITRCHHLQLMAGGRGAGGVKRRVKAEVGGGWVAGEHRHIARAGWRHSVKTKNPHNARTSGTDNSSMTSDMQSSQLSRGYEIHVASNPGNNRGAVQGEGAEGGGTGGAGTVPLGRSKCSRLRHEQLCLIKRRRNRLRY